MTTIGLVADDQSLEVAVNPVITSGEENTVILHVDFSEDWNGFGKTAVFFTEKNKNTLYEKIMSGGECIVPSEVMVNEGTFLVGIRGVNSTSKQVKTTSLVKYKISKGTPAVAEFGPTPDVYEQLLSAYEKADSSIVKLNSDIEFERARIDNLSTLKEGGTTADAELIDIRVKADGSTATSAGNAVREQITELKGDLYVKLPYTEIKGNYTFVIGAKNNYGVNVESTNRITPKTHTTTGPDVLIFDKSITISHDNYDICAVGVSTYENIGSVSNWMGWLTEPYTVPANTYFNIMIKHLDDSTITDVATDITYTGLRMELAKDSYIPYKNLCKTIIVDAKGNGQFRKIQDAVNYAKDGDVIYVKDGMYNENVVNTKHITVIGQSKEKTILYNTTGEYTTPPLWTCSGHWENITVYAWNKDGKSFDTITKLGYAFHLDQKWDINHNKRNIEIRNCIFKSDFNDAIGCGMDADSFIDISDTICEATKRSGMKIHPFPTTGTSKILLRNNVFKKGIDSNAFGLLFHTGGTDGTHFNTIEVEAYNNIAENYDGVDANCFIMNEYNYGNTLSCMNRFSFT